MTPTVQDQKNAEEKWKNKKKTMSEVPPVYLRDRSGTRFRREQVLNSIILFYLLSPFSCLYEIHVYMCMFCIYVSISVQSVYACLCTDMCRPKVNVKKTSPFHYSIIHWHTVSWSVQSFPIWLVLLASLHWGSLSPPSRAGITGNLPPTAHLHGFWTVVHMLA